MISMPRSSWFAPLIFLVAFVLVLCAVIYVLNDTSRRLRTTELIGDVESARQDIHQRLESNQEYLKMLADDRASGLLDAVRFQDRGSQYVAAHPELINITWVDTTSTVMDVAPREPNKLIIGLRLYLPEPSRASQLSRARKEPVYTHVFEAIQGRPSFEIWVPVFRGDRFLGFFAGVYSVERTLHTLTSEAILTQYRASLVAEDGRTVAETQELGTVDASQSRDTAFPAPESGLHLRFQRYESSLSWPSILLLGLGLALVMGMAFVMWRLKEEMGVRKLADDALRESESRLRFALEGTNDGLWDVQMKTGKAYLSPRACELLGYEPHEGLTVAKVWSQLVHPDDMPLTLERLNAHLEGKAAIFDVEQRLHMKSGEWKWVRARGKVVARDDGGNPLRMTGTHTDISEQKRAKEQVYASLREKEMLLKEIHHRVKNNMQVITSLLNLGIQDVKDGTAREIIQESMNRIRSMALVHEKLYKSETFAAIDFGAYLNSVVEELRRTYHKEGILWSVEAEKVSLGVDTAVPCGLIVNELVSNAFKHAFEGQDAGTVTVGIHRVDERLVQLQVHDNGIGFPEGKDFRNMTSMGMSLVVSLTDQISGTIALDTTAGTTFTITFPA